MADDTDTNLSRNDRKDSPSTDNDDENVLELSLETHKETKIESDIDNTASSAGDSLLTGDNNDNDNNADTPTAITGPDSLADPPKDTNQKKRSKTLPDGTSGPIVVDASDHIAGRLSSFVAKMLLQGKRVSLVNCERIMISGTRKNTIYEYRQFLKINSIINPKHGPVHYRRPDTVITKMIRGMLPFEKKPSGKTAHKRLRAYVGSPKELKQFKKVQFEKAKITRSPSSYTTMGELCRVIGWTE